MSGDGVRDARRPVRVMVLENEFNMGGSEKKLFDFIERRDPGRVDVSVCCLKEAGYFGGPLRALGVPVDERVMHGRFDARGVSRFGTVVRERTPDVIYTMAHPNTVLLAAWARSRKRIRRFVVSFHAMGSPDGGRLVPVWMRPVIHRADRLLAVAEMHRDYLAETEGLDARRIEVIHNGVDTTKYHFASPAERAASRRDLGLGDDDVVFTEVASIKPAKRQHVLLRAVAPVMQQDGRLHLVLAGDGPSRRDCESLCGELGISDRVHFLGIRRDVERVLHASDVLVLPSRMGTETFPNVVLEAMASGLAVVATGVGSVREMVEDGKSALIVDPDDARGLTAAIRALAADADLRRRMGARGRKLVETRFPIELMCRKREDLFERLVAGRGTM